MNGGGDEHRTLRLVDSCGEIELTPQTWVDLGIDEYLSSYPNADKLTIQEFAAELNVPNFFCGVGMQCLAGQLCSPAVGINWIILYAVQQWNNYMNSLYDATAEAFMMMKDAISSVVSDFTGIAPDQQSIYGWSLATVVCGVLNSITALAAPAFLPADSIIASLAAIRAGPGIVGHPKLGIGKDKSSPPDGQMAYDAAKAAISRNDLDAYDEVQGGKDANDIRRAFLPEKDLEKRRSEGNVEWDAPDQMAQQLQMIVAPPVNENLLKGNSEGSSHHLKGKSASKDPDPKERPKLVRRGIKHKKGSPSPYAYTRYAYMEAHLENIKNRIQGFVVITTRLGTMAPILAKGGIASILKGGEYLSPNPEKDMLNVKGQKLAQITALGQIMQSLVSFFHIGELLDDCKYKGPNGAWDGDENLSYCSPEGLMRNIIQASEDKALNNIPNAKLILKKYGYTTEFLTQSAWDCQKKYGIYTNSTAEPPVSLNSDCIFPLPVCDCTLDEVAHLRKKKKSTVEACRIGANLPI
ncbi:hypothetical protein BY996DRAFT_4593587 [Phakopsora pachyrhizi]|nr:hypothetical protein BY996DRAFT_4596892 [Phakopsora pachyrhizi]KAI8447253.1 hypothetical protein BY996DRAFT_4593587 [Phakopsora pachyrhizi]